MSLFLPFNFNSGQTLQVTNGNYTIPAGKYAFLSCHCKEGETLIIDGIQAQSGGASVTAVSIGVSGISANSDSYLIPNDGRSYFTGHGSVSGNSAQASGGGAVILPTDGNGDAPGSSAQRSSHGVIYAGPGQSISVSIGSTGVTNSASISGFVKVDGSDTTQTYWLSEGTALTGTATKTITLFDIP